MKGKLTMEDIILRALMESGFGLGFPGRRGSSLFDRVPGMTIVLGGSSLSQFMEPMSEVCAKYVDKNPDVFEHISEIFRGVNIVEAASFIAKAESKDQVNLLTLALAKVPVSGSLANIPPEGVDSSRWRQALKDIGVVSQKYDDGYGGEKIVGLEEDAAQNAIASIVDFAHDHSEELKGIAGVAFFTIVLYSARGWVFKNLEKIRQHDENQDKMFPVKNFAKAFAESLVTEKDPPPFHSMNRSDAAYAITGADEKDQANWFMLAIAHTESAEFERYCPDGVNPVDWLTCQLDQEMAAEMYLEQLLEEGITSETDLLGIVKSILEKTHEESTLHHYRWAAFIFYMMHLLENNVKDSSVMEETNVRDSGAITKTKCDTCFRSGSCQAEQVVRSLPHVPILT
jgi:hypothetical protein